MSHSKKTIFAAVFVLVLVGAAFILVSRSTSKDRPSVGQSQEPPSSSVDAGGIGVPGAIPVTIPASHAVTPPAVIPVPVPKKEPALGPSVMDVVSGDIEAPKDVFKEPFIKRSRPIAINPEILEKTGNLAVGSRLDLTLFPDAKYTVTLQRVNRGPQGDLSLSGKLDGEEYGTFVLSAASGVVLVRLADPAAGKLFLVRCNGSDRIHYAVEVDPAKVPVPKPGVPDAFLNIKKANQDGGSK